MFNRTILTISPQATSWVRRDTQVLLLHHFTRRKIYLEDANAYFWEIIFKCSDFEDIQHSAIVYIRKYFDVLDGASEVNTATNIAKANYP